MAYDFSPFKKQAEEIKQWLINELSAIRTGRATTAFLDNIRVDAYGSKTPLNQMASVTTEDARSIRVAPWDTSLIGAAERAINDAQLGVSVSTDERGLRVNFPALTSETRAQILKIAKARHEDARIRLRQAREKVKADLQEKKKNSELPEDDMHRHSDDLQKMVDTMNSEFDLLYETKEKEILG